MTSTIEAERLTRQEDMLTGLGFTREEAEQLRRISMTLRRWFEHECNGVVQRDEATEKPYAVVQHYYRGGMENRYPVADREKGARKRLAAIVAARNKRDAVALATEDVLDRRGAVSAYVQTDPRGAALYILRPGDVPEGQDAGSYYTRGICVY
jgi:hypothetical protein